MTTIDPFLKRISIPDDPKDHLYNHGLTVKDVVAAVSRPKKVLGSSYRKKRAVYFAMRPRPVKNRIYNAAVVEYNNRDGGRVITIYPTNKIGGKGVVVDDIRYES
jgi:hypothetical protein